jgi:hypothetical protein
MGMELGNYIYQSFDFVIQFVCLKNKKVFFLGCKFVSSNPHYFVLIGVFYIGTVNLEDCWLEIKYYF